MFHHYGDTFCLSCIQHLSFLYTTHPMFMKLEQQRDEFIKNGIKGFNYLYDCVENEKLSRCFDKENFEEFLLFYYNRIVGYQFSEQTIIKINESIDERWNSISRKYQNLCFPKLEKHHHVCATRYKDNLILIENSTPKMKIEMSDTKEYSEKIFNQFNNTENENLFAISVIPLENIVSYQLIGDVEHVAMVSGGGGRGGQPNLTGAAIGGMLFGDAGAIIGAQTGFCIDPIKSTITEFDSRVTMLNLKNAEGQVEIKELPYYYSEVFMKVIPEKEFNFLQANKNTEAPVQSQTAPALNMVEEMKQLKELLDLNLITQEEFDAKRQQILKL